MTEETAITFAPALQPAVITADFTGMRERLDGLLAGLDTSDEALEATGTADLKRRRRDVNGIIKSVDDGRKAIKREYNRSLDAFEAEVKDVLSTARDASERLKAEIDRREEAARDGRREQLERAYEDMAPVLVPVVPFERLCEDKWLTQTGYKRAMPELEAKVSQLAADWDSLQSMMGSLPCYDVAESELFLSLDLGRAIQSARDEQSRRDAIAQAKAERDANLAAARAEADPDKQEQPEEPAETDSAESVKDLAERQSFERKVREMAERSMAAMAAKREAEQAKPAEGMPGQWMVSIPSATRAQVEEFDQRLKAMGLSAIPRVVTIPSATRAQMQELAQRLKAMGLSGRIIRAKAARTEE